MVNKENLTANGLFSGTSGIAENGTSEKAHYGKRAEYCFESTVSEERELTEFCGKLGEFALAHK